MYKLGAGDAYFDVYVEADEHLSIIGMAYIDVQDPELPRGRALIAKALEGIGLWAATIHSWIGIEVSPNFNLDGTLKKRTKFLSK